MLAALPPNPLFDVFLGLSFVGAFTCLYFALAKPQPRTLVRACLWIG
jgi:hypothetical protein